MTIVITGGSGYIGTALTKRLLSLNHRVVVIDTHAPVVIHSNLFFISCDITAAPLPYGVLEQTDAIINLAGYPIATKWTKEVMDKIRSSRVESTKHIIETIRNTQNKPSCFICASAVGYYGDTGEVQCDEKCTRGEGFLSGVVSEWEAVAEEATELGVRTVCVRTAPVLGPNGFQSKIAKTGKFGFLLKLKKKDFWMSWIHLEDIVSTYVFTLETSTVQGVFNACAPESLLHSEFMKTLGKTIKRKVIGSIPTTLAKKLFGGLFDEITKNQRVSPKRLLDKGFVFSYPKLEDALKEIYRK